MKAGLQETRQRGMEFYFKTASHTRAILKIILWKVKDLRNAMNICSWEITIQGQNYLES